jgi:hypothetical protein
LKDRDELVTWLTAALTGEPISKKRTRKPRKPVTEEQKAAFRARMVKGQEEAKKSEAAAKSSSKTKSKSKS